MFATLSLAAVLGWAVDGADEPRRFTRLELIGERSIDRAQLQRAVNLPLPADSLQAALRRLGMLYYQRGFLHATLRPEPVADSFLRIWIDEGEPSRIAHLFVRGAQLLTNDELLARLGIGPGDLFRGPEIEKRLQLLLEEFARQGHLYATAVIERMELSAEGVVLGIAVSEGPKALLAEVRVQGNSHTRASLIERLADLEPGQRADLGRVREAAQLLRRSGLFAEVQEPVLYRVGGGGRQVGVVLPLSELTRRNTVFGSVGVAQDPRDDTPYLNGALDLQLRNIYGTGRDLGIAWKRDALAGSRLKLGYRERFVLGWRLDLGLDLEQNVRDSTYTWQSVGAAITLPLSRTLALELGSAFDRSVFHTRLQGSSRRFRQRIGLLFRSLAVETEGRRYGTLEVRAEYARKSNQLDVAGMEDRSKVRQTLWSGTFAAGVPLAPRHVLAARGEWHVVDSNEAEIAESELYHFGGARSLRGYREDQFRGDKVAFGGLEYRFGDPRGARLYGFSDVGALQRRRSDGSLEESVHLGFGLGLRGQVAAGIFDLSFGMGEERSFSAVKVHVSLLQSF